MVISRTSPQVHSAPSPFPREVGEEAGNISKRYGDGTFSAVTLTGRPVNKARTGRMSAAVFIYAIAMTDYATTIGITVSLLFYLYTYFYQNFSDGATITNNYTGTTFLLSVLGGFLADSYLGHYVTIVIGGAVQMLGMAVLVLSSDVSGLQPAACTPTLTAPCPKAGTKYMAPIFVALYTIALGSGFVKAGTPALGAEQFDESDEREKRQSVHYFIWFFFAQNVGLVVAFSLGVYILSYVSKDWGWAWLLILYGVSYLIFLAGTFRYRHKKPGGSFLGRFVKVAVCAVRKRNLVVPEDANTLYDAPISGGWLRRSRKLRFLDKASIIENEAERSNPWRLAGVTQIEETKRILQILPVWTCTWYVSLLFAQATTFTATQAQSLSRSLGKHFIVPQQSVAILAVSTTIVFVPIFDYIIRPILRKLTKNPFGITPLLRIGIGLVAASLGMVSAALVERKRVGYVRDLGYQHALLFELPMSWWWLYPQLFFTSMAEFFVILGMYDFFYHEVSDNTRGIGTSFSYSAISMGYYFSSVLVNVTNSVTRHRNGGRWLVERLNDGGLEYYYWLLAIIVAVDFLVFIVVSSFYQYNYTLYLPQKNEMEETHRGRKPAVS